MDDAKREPSLWMGTLAGYGIGCLVGGLIILGISLGGRPPYASGCLRILVPFAIVGFVSGHWLTATIRKSRGFVGPLDDFGKLLSHRGSLLLIVGFMVVAIAMTLAIKGTLVALRIGDWFVPPPTR